VSEETRTVATASTVNAIRQFLPRGNTIDDAAFTTRHGWLCWLLGLHVPVLIVFGMLEGFGFAHSLTAVWVPMVCLLIGLHVRQRRVASMAVTVGLVACSTILVHLAGGATEAYLHVFLMIGFIALYQDWIPFAGAVGFTLVSTIAVPDGLFVDVDHDRSWAWVLGYVAALALAAFAQILLWRATEDEQRKSVRLASELARAQTQIEARQSVSELFVNLARRNQALLDRQINLLVAMEERQADPDELADLFQLDHLATRIRRNAESLLVLSGEEPARRWGRPVPLPEVVRAAIAEVEDFRRADMDIDEGVAVAGRAVADLAHLLAELVENGLQFSPPESKVRVWSQSRPDGADVLVVEDHGVGMSERDLAAANELLAHPPEVDLGLSKRLGFHVVARLAARYGMRVALSPTRGGGVTVAVVLPDDLATRAELPNGFDPSEDDDVEPDAVTPPAARRFAAPRPAAPAEPAAAPVVAVAAVAAPRSSSPATPLPRPAHASEPTVPPNPILLPRELPVPVAAAVPEPVLEPAVVGDDPAPVAGNGSTFGETPLVQRVPQASLDPRMRTDRQPPAPRPRGNGVGGRSPEDLRAQLSQFQAAQARARRETSAPGTTVNGQERQ
jgi:signal transduction histidine kinase